MLLILGSIGVDSGRPLSLLLSYLGYTYYNSTPVFYLFINAPVISYAAMALQMDRIDFGSPFVLMVVDNYLKALSLYF
jgi:hypothetical protein